MKGLIGVTLFVAAAWVAADARWDAYSDDTWPRPEDVRVTEADLAFTNETFDRTKNEGIFFMSRFNDGWVLMLNLFRFDHVLFHRWGIYMVVAEPDGTEHWATLDLDGPRVVFDTDRLYVTDGVNVIEGGPDVYRVRLALDGVACELHLSNLLNAWQPGSGYYNLDEDGRSFQRRIVAAPWALVEGWVELDGERMQISGEGYAEKSLIVNSLRRLNPILYSVRVYSPEKVPLSERWHVGLLDTTAHSAYGGQRQARLLVGHGGQWLFATTDYEVEPLRAVEGVELSYVLPVSLRISARSAGYFLEGVYTAETLFNVTDVMDEVPQWLRTILLLFLKRPIYFRFIGRFEGTLRGPGGIDEPIELYGPYEYVVVR